MTQSTGSEAPAEAATDAPTGSPAQPHPTLPDGFGDLDRRAIDTARVLAMDAVQKVGNGHPGTAMSMAPDRLPALPEVAAARPERPELGRPRPVRALDGPLEPDALRAALPLRLRHGARGPAGAAHLGLADARATPRSATPPASRRPPARWARASATPSAWRWPPAASAACSTPTPPRARACSTTPSGCFASDGDLEEGVSGEASSLAGTQQLGNLVLVYDDNKISIEDDTNVAFTEDVGKRYEAYGWHVQRVDDGEDLAAVDAAFAAAKAETGRPSFIVLKTIIGWPAPNKQNTGAAHGSALGEDEVKATKEVLGLDPEQDLRRRRRGASSTPARSSTAARRRTPPGRSASTPGQQSNPDGAALLERMSTRTLPDGLGREAAQLGRPTPKGVATRKASGEVLAALYPALPELWGGSADLAESNNTAVKGEPSFLPAEPRRRRCGPAAPTAARCTSASASTPWARS